MRDSLTAVALLVLTDCSRRGLSRPDRLAWVHFGIPHELVVMDTAIAREDLQISKLLECLGPTPDAANGGLAVFGEASLGYVEARASPAVGDENQPEPMRAGCEGWLRRVFCLQDAVGYFGVVLK